jgi:hypothetical protein
MVGFEVSLPARSSRALVVDISPGDDQGPVVTPLASW